MPIILLIRHAENDYAKHSRLAGRLPGIHLNETGRQQAQALAEKLASVPIQAIYSSPLERALETAAPLAEKLNLPVIPRDGLLETDLGEWQGRSIKTLKRLKAWQVLQNTPSQFCFPGGESVIMCQARLVAEMEAIRSMHTAEAVLACVLHADPIKQVVAHYLGLPVDLYQRLALDLASITVLCITEQHTRLVVLNYVGSLHQVIGQK